MSLALEYDFSGLMLTALTALISTHSTKVSSLTLLVPVQRSPLVPPPSAETVPPPVGLLVRETETVQTAACAALMAVPTHAERQRRLQLPRAIIIQSQGSPLLLPLVGQWSPLHRPSMDNLIGEDNDVVNAKYTTTIFLYFT